MSALGPRCLAHLLALATTMAVAKVFLTTIAVTLFLIHEGPQRLPAFYVLFAGAAIVLSFGLGAVVDRAPRIGLAQVAFAGVLIGAAALRLPLALGLPGAHFLLLASAHIYEIVLDIVFWVVVAAFLDAVEFRRATPLIYMALALGGALGGGLARGLAEVMGAADMLWALPLLAACLVAQLGLAQRRLRMVPDTPGAQGREDHRGSPLQLARLLERYPLALLIALNALVLTILYGLCEYLVFTIYSAHFPEEGEMTRFLAVVFAGLQVIELALLYAVSRPLLLRTGPLARNLVFPITSLASLVCLVLSQKLPAAIVTHVNAEAISNAIFQPVNNANYVSLPLRFQGRARTLADGIFYPAGLAVAGALLMLMSERATFEEIGFAALLFALVFLLLNIGVGALFLPTLLANLRPCATSAAPMPRTTRPPVAVPPARVRQLLRSRDPQLRLLGLALARHLAPAELADELVALPPLADRASQRALARLLADGGAAVTGVIEALLESDHPAARRAALTARLAHRQAVPAAIARRLASDRSAGVRALALLLERAGDAAPGVMAMAQERDVAAAVIDALVDGDRRDLAGLAAMLLPAAPAASQALALRWLRETAKAPLAAGAARALAGASDPAVRAEAIACLGATDPQALVRWLDDPSPAVRTRTVALLSAVGDRAGDLLAARLAGPLDEGAAAAALALAHIGSRRARALLETALARLETEVATTAGWLRRLLRSPDRMAWAALEIAIADHHRRALELAFGLLAARRQGPRVNELRQALRSSDQRTRAAAHEALASWPDRRLASAVTRILEPAPAADDHPCATARMVVPLALASRDRWIRAAAEAIARRQAVAAPSAWSPEMDPIPGEADLERVLALKRTPLFRYLPLDSLLAVARGLEARRHLAGEEIVAQAASQDWLGIVESGSVRLVGGDGNEEIIAPGLFGEVVLVGELPPYRRVEASADTSLLRLHRVVFEDLGGEHPEIVMELCRLLARRLRRAHDRPAREAVAKSSAEW